MSGTHVPGLLFLTVLWFLLAGPAVANADVYRLRINAGAEKGQLLGQLDLSYRNRGTEPLDELRLRLDTNLSSVGTSDILSVHAADGSELTWRYLPYRFARLESKRAQVGVTLPQPLPPAEQVELKIAFEIDSSKLVSDEVHLQDDPFHSFDAWYPKAMTRKGGTWSVNDDRPSAYYVTVELPSEMTVASTGRVVAEERTAEGRKVLRLRAEGVRGFTIYGSPARTKHRQKVGETELSVDLPEAARQWAEPMLNAAADAIAFYSRHYGEFPTQHLDIICPGSLTGRAHGSSAACNVITIWLGGQLEKQYRWLTAHEVAHQYFGSLIGCRRREIAWVPIGLGQIMDRHYMQDRGLDMSRIARTMGWFYFEAQRRGYNTSLSQPVEKPMVAEPPWCYGWNMALMHGKAYFVCAMLQDMVGREEFQGIISDIIADEAGGLIGAGDLIGRCEESLGESLDWFVRDWIDGQAHLDYAVAGVTSADGGWEVEISRVGTASYPVEIEVETRTGQTLRRRIDRKKETNRLHFATENELAKVVIDPEGICPDMDSANNRWPRSP